MSTVGSNSLAVKIWSLGSSTPNFQLEAHETKGVNHVDYYPHSDKPYLLTTSDDRTVKIWDYTTKSLIATLEGHTNNVSFACYHPELPIIISGSEDVSREFSRCDRPAAYICFRVR
jgi:coatomer subunit beta'